MTDKQPRRWWVRPVDFSLCDLAYTDQEIIEGYQAAGIELIEVEEVLPGNASDLESQKGHLLGLLQQVYWQAGNSAPAHKRHALTPGLRDAIRDTLEANAEPEEPF